MWSPTSKKVNRKGDAPPQSFVTGFLSDPGKPGVWSMGPSLWNLQHSWLDLTDVTLADEDTNSILTDNAKRVIQGNEAMQAM